MSLAALEQAELAVMAFVKLPQTSGRIMQAMLLLTAMRRAMHVYNPAGPIFFLSIGAIPPIERRG